VPAEVSRGAHIRTAAARVGVTTGRHGVGAESRVFLDILLVKNAKNVAGGVDLKKTERIPFSLSHNSRTPVDVPSANTRARLDRISNDKRARLGASSLARARFDLQRR